MYINELEKRLTNFKISSSTFIVGSNGLLWKFDQRTGVTRIINSYRILSQLTNFDLIHVQFSFPLGFAFGLFKSIKLLRKPILVHTHGYDIFSVPSVSYGIRREFIGRVLAKFAWDKANIVIAVCEKARLVLEKSGLSTEKIRVLYNGVDHKLFQKNSQVPEDIKLIKKDADVVFLTIGSLVPVKNHIRLFKSFTKLQNRYKSKYNIKLVVIGRNPMNSQVGCPTDSVIYLGTKGHRELPRYYSAADVFVLPSLSEAHPWSLLEAMSCELVVAASNVGGIPETISDERFLLMPNDTNDIVNKLGTLIEMGKNERENVGRQNRRKVLNQFTLDEHIMKMTKIYSEMLSNQ